MAEDSFDIVIVGAGFAGSALAIHLARAIAPGTRVLLLGTSGETARGLAYSTTSPVHLLNVRAGRMSLDRDAPDHFAAWLQRQGLAAGDPGETYAPRMVYGRYVADHLRAAVDDGGGALRVIEDRATAVVRDKAGFRVTTATGRSIGAARVVLTIGHGPASLPLPPGSVPAALGDRLIVDPWRNARMGGIGPDERVLFIGSSQTMADHAVALAAGGHRGAMLAISRNGRLPETQLRPQADPVTVPLERTSLAGLYRSIVAACRREIAAGRDWRAVIDGLRPLSQDLWAGLTIAERRRFARHAESLWTIHRSRLAPEVGAAIAGLRAAGQLEVRAARIVALAPDEAGVAVTLRPRGGTSDVTERVDWMVNCSGIARLRDDAMEPVLARAMADGLVRRHALRGIDVDDSHAVIGRDGIATPGLYAIGTLAGGHFFESVAVPELAAQAARLARALASPAAA